MPDVHEQQEVLRRGHLAPSPRTLVDVFENTVRRHPDAAAIDDGRRSLTYRELAAEVDRIGSSLVSRGVRGGDRVGVRLPSGSVDLYAGILAVLTIGACYVPVDADDPAERAELVFAEAGVVTVLVDGPAQRPLGVGAARRPGLDDDAWIIFTSGSTGTPKGVAVTHRSAAAFVDAEARLTW